MASSRVAQWPCRSRPPAPRASRPCPRARMTTDAPTPDLPRGAGGPLRRAAGRVSAPPALVIEPDPLARLLVEPAVAALGFAILRDACGIGAAGPADARSPGRVPRRPPSSCRWSARATAGGRSKTRAGWRIRRRSSSLLRRHAGAARRSSGAPLRRRGALAHGLRRRAPLRPSAGARRRVRGRALAARGGRAGPVAPRAHDPGHRSLSRRRPQHGAHALPGGAAQDWGPATGGRCAPGSSPARTPNCRRPRGRLRRPGPQVCRGRGASFAEESSVESPLSGAHTWANGRGTRRGVGPRPSDTTPQRRGMDERRRADGGPGTQPQAVAGPPHHRLLHDLHPRVGRLVRHRGHGLVVGARPHHPAALLLPIFWSMPMALVASELGSALPGEGGFYVWARRGLGDFWGFQTAWWWSLSIFVDSSVYIVLAVGYLQNWLHFDQCWFYVICWAIIAAFTVMNIFGVQLVALWAPRCSRCSSSRRSWRSSSSGIAKWQFNPLTPFTAAGRAVLRQQRRARSRPGHRRVDVLRLRVDVHALGRDPEPAAHHPARPHAGRAVHHRPVRAADGGRPRRLRPLGHLGDRGRRRLRLVRRDRPQARRLGARGGAARLGAARQPRALPRLPRLGRAAAVRHLRRRPVPQVDLDA